MSQIVYEGKMRGAFYGFNENAVFEMTNGTYWIQSKYKYWYKYKYRPNVVISKDGSKCILHVEGKSIPVKRLTDVFKSQIDGEFNGWDGKTVYELTNRTTYQQVRYKYVYKYIYRPEVLVYSFNGRTIMRVEDVEAEVRRIR